MNADGKVPIEISEAMRAFKTTKTLITPFGDACDIPIDSTLMVEYLGEIKKVGQVSRIDLAVDDVGGNYFTIDSLVDIMEKKRNVSKFRNWRNLLESSMTGEKAGHTLYLGSRKSDIYLRVYDKKLEQNKKLSASGENLIRTEWIRWELELKNERAQECVKMLLTKKETGAVCVGILSNYFRVIELDNENKSSVWMRFIGEMEKIDTLYSHLPKDIGREKEMV